VVIAHLLALRIASLLFSLLLPLLLFTRMTTLGFDVKIHPSDHNRDSLAHTIDELLHKLEELDDSIKTTDAEGNTTLLVEVARTTMFQNCNDQRWAVSAVKIRTNDKHHKEVAEAMLGISDQMPGTFTPVSLKCSEEISNQRLFVGHIQQQQQHLANHAAVILEGLSCDAVNAELKESNEEGEPQFVCDCFEMKGFELIETTTTETSGIWKIITAKAKKAEHEAEADEILSEVKAAVDPAMWNSRPVEESEPKKQGSNNRRSGKAECQSSSNNVRSSCPMCQRQTAPFLTLLQQRP